MDDLVRIITARDGFGAEVKVFEYRRNVPGETSSGVRYMRKVRHLVLESGETAKYVDENTFLLEATSENLFRIKSA